MIYIPQTAHHIKGRGRYLICDEKKSNGRIWNRFDTGEECFCYVNNVKTRFFTKTYKYYF